MNPVVRPPIEHIADMMLSNRVDLIMSSIIRKGNKAPKTSKTKPIAISFSGLSISLLYL
jgi:hypothetical protein